MAISRRTATTGTFTASQTAAITLPTGATSGDFLVAVVGNAGTTGPEAPVGWSLAYSASAGSGQCCSVFTAPYSPGLTLTFTNAASVAAWACNAYLEASRFISLDVAAVAATNITTNTTLPTGAPTTGAAAGDSEVLLYTWTSAATISTVASGSTIEATRANSTAVSVAIGFNNTASLPASTPVTAFSQTLSATNTRKTGVGLLLKSTVPATRQVGGADVTVEHTVTLDLNRRTGALAIMVDLVLGVGPATYPLTVTASQSTAPTVQLDVHTLSIFSLTGTATQAQGLTLRRAVQLTRARTQSTALALFAEGLGPVVVPLLVTATQGTLAARRKAVALARGVTVGQAASVLVGRGFRQTVAAIQSTAVSLRKAIGLRRMLTGSHRISTRVSLRGLNGRLLRATQPTAVRLIRRIMLAPRTVGQPQTVGGSGIPVQLLLGSTVQARSLDLVRNVALRRSIAQPQASLLQRDPQLRRTVTQPTLARLLQASIWASAVSQPTAVALEWRNVTPRYDILVTASVSQQVSLSSAGTGQSAKQFRVDTRRAEFVVGSRASSFAVGRRGVRFTVEER